MSPHRHFMRALFLALLVILAPSLIAQNQDPQKGEVVLDEREGWESTLVFDAGCGVWCVRSFQLYPELACPEIVAADDRGRATILISYSGKWTPKATVLDGQWLAPMVQGRYGMGEGVMLLAGAGGRLYEVKPRAEGHADVLLRAELPGEEIHTMLRIADPRPQATDRALLFLKSGRLIEYRWVGTKCMLTELPAVEGRVRDALVETEKGENGTTTIWTVSRAGQVVRRVFDFSEGQAGKRRDEIITSEAMGLGRIARGSGAFEKYFYVTRDDGVYLRLSRDGQRGWTREVIHRGEQGPRGIVAGRFDDDPEVETLAIFGYSGKVELLARKGDAPFTARTLFVDSDAGHWLAKAELDGRNETEEIISSGFSGRVVLHSRQRARTKIIEDEGKASFIEPDAQPKAPTPEEAEESGPQGAAHKTRSGPLRIAVASLPASREIDPLRYGGGFFTKVSTYATLVERDSKGNLIPGLALFWWYEDEGRSWFFRIDRSRVLHDGSNLDAKVVAEHFRRVVGKKEHSWLGLARYTKAIETPADDLVVFRLDRPWAIEEELVAYNPCGIMAPGSFDAEGRFLRPLGSGSLRPRVEDMTAERLTYVDTRSRPVFELVAIDGGPAGYLAALEEGRVDLVIDGWERSVPRRNDGHYPQKAAGSSLIYLVPNVNSRFLATPEQRVQLSSSIDRDRLIEVAESGYAGAARQWRSEGDHGSSLHADSNATFLVLINGDESWQLDVARGLRSLESSAKALFEFHFLSGKDYEAERAAGAFDLVIEKSWGGPYEPFLSLVGHFAKEEDQVGLAPALVELIARLGREPSAGKRLTLWSEVEELIQKESVLIPLYRPARLWMANRSLRPFDDVSSPYSLPFEARAARK